MTPKERRSRDRRADRLLFYVGQRVDRSGATRVDLRRWAYAGLALLLIGTVGWLYLEQTSRVASYGYEIRQLEERKETLRRELTALRAEVATASSLQRIRAVGESAGYAMPDMSDPSTYVVIEYRLPPTPAPETADLAR